MATIEDGYGGDPLVIKVKARDDKLSAEVWTEMSHQPAIERLETDERLHYASLNELITLRDELNEAIKSLAGV